MTWCRVPAVLYSLVWFLLLELLFVSNATAQEEQQDGEELQEEFPTCDPPCSIPEFCGTDGTCYAYDCRNLYEFGPVAYTGRSSMDNDDEPLTCTTELPVGVNCTTDFFTDDLATVLSPWPLAMWPLCYPLSVYPSPRVGCPLEEAYDDDATTKSRMLEAYNTMNQYCFAKHSSGTTFMCYGIAPETSRDDYLGQYLDDVSQLPECTANYSTFEEGTYEDDTVVPANVREYSWRQEMFAIMNRPGRGYLVKLEDPEDFRSILFSRLDEPYENGNGGDGIPTDISSGNHREYGSTALAVLMVALLVAMPL